MKRGKNKIQVDYSSPEIYQSYCESLIDKEGIYKVSKTVFTKVLKEANMALLELMMLYNFEFKIPCRLGTMSLRKKKVQYKLKEDGTLDTKGLSVNYKLTNELWNNDPEAKKNRVKIYHTNEHYDGYKVNFYWSKKNSLCKGLSIVQFKSSRYAKRKLNNYLKDTNLSLEFYERPAYSKRIKNAT